MTDTDYNFLQKFEKSFKTAKESNYSSAIPTKDLLKMDEVYVRVKGSSVKPKNFSCPSCNLTFLKKIGEMYSEEKELRSTMDSNLND